jgi:hypothetical protein
MCPRYTFRTKDEKLMKDFHDAVIENNTSLYGNVNKSHDMAIKLFLASINYKDYATKISFLSGPTGLKIEESPTHKKLTKKRRTILKAFEEELNNSDRITDDELTKFIELTMGDDPRTVKKWTKFLVTIEFIRKDSLLYWTNIAPVEIYKEFPELAPVRVQHD